MGTRFEILHNGERVCISGIDGAGVLTAILKYAGDPRGSPLYGLHIGGLGSYTGDNVEQQHVHWNAPDVKEGDEVTIRILPAGEFDNPAEVSPASHIQRTIEDPDFGLMEFHVQVWEADIAWNFPPFKTAQLHLLADFSGPTNLQRQLLRELKQQFTALWPKIADAIAECDAETTTLQELDKRVSPGIRISMRHNSYQVCVTVWVPMETRCHSFVVTLRDWKILDIMLTLDI